MASRRKFSDEYKREAVRLATEPGVTRWVAFGVDCPVKYGSRFSYFGYH